MNTWPLQFRPSGESQYLFSNDNGAFFMASSEFLGRYVKSDLTKTDEEFLAKHGHSFTEIGDYRFTGFASRWASKLNPAKELSYLILVPTLRCNLKCDYCQVSRVAENAKGFDWDEKKLSKVVEFLDELTTPDIKIEFQGGEPLLRLDILENIRTFCRERFEICRICSLYKSAGRL